MPNIDDLEHDSLEEASKPKEAVELRGGSLPKPLPKAKPPMEPGALARMRREMKEAQGEQKVRLPWLRIDNPAIWSGDSGELDD